MTSRNPKSCLKISRAVACKDYASATPATTDCVAVDTKGFTWATCIMHTGVMTVAAGNLPLIIVESSDNFSSDTATAVTGAAWTALDGGDDNEVHTVTVNCSKTERYLKVQGTSPTTSTVMLLSGVWVLSGPIDSAYVGTGGVDASHDAIVP